MLMSSRISSKFIRILPVSSVAIGAILLLCVSAHAYAESAKATKNTKTPKSAPAKLQPISASDLSSIRVTKYEIALVQVMAEICPQMLNARQRAQFYEAYGNQLRAFIPSTEDPERILDYLSSQRDYRAILQSVRAWTASFPRDENYEVCADFANIGRAF